jgi:hypothetical protein
MCGEHECPIQVRCGIYAIVHRETGDVYIGQSGDIDVRWKSHRVGLRAQTHPSLHLQRAWNSYGEHAFDFVVLEECAPEQLTIREKEYIYILQPRFNAIMPQSLRGTSVKDHPAWRYRRHLLRTATSPAGTCHTENGGQLDLFP